ncbi:hypothetical protein ABGB18_11385 [Nonomuraea sp. B12E4]|uniref:hypothetical protein n=1 Tax=Nonomuraea sp. B12E4 TaxID=3153564 RepID=UPI00325C9811
MAAARHIEHMGLLVWRGQLAGDHNLPKVPPMTAAERFRFQVIAAWQVGCIERADSDRREYIGRHHRKP